MVLKKGRENEPREGRGMLIMLRFFFFFEIMLRLNRG